MKNLLFFFVSLAFPFVFFSQETQKTDSIPDGWATSGNVSLLFNQAAFNAEWTGGGTSNYAANATLTYDFNYRKGKTNWDNRILADYGISKNKDEEFSRKTNDRLELNSILGRQIKDSSWYYSLFFYFKTQFSSGYEYAEDDAGKDLRTEVTKFMSPGYLQFGPGIMWKKNDNFKLNLSPATARLIIVSNNFTEVDDTDPGALEAYNENPYFGVDANETTRFEFGASLSGYAKFDAMENVTVENILNLYSNYLDEPQNVDIDYTLNLILKVNSYISANFTLQAIYDDNAVQGFQVREALGVGVNYGF